MHGSPPARADHDEVHLRATRARPLAVGEEVVASVGEEVVASVGEEVVASVGECGEFAGCLLLGPCRNSGLGGGGASWRCASASTD